MICLMPVKFQWYANEKTAKKESNPYVDMRMDWIQKLHFNIIIPSGADGYVFYGAAHGLLDETDVPQGCFW